MPENNFWAVLMMSGSFLDASPYTPEAFLQESLSAHSPLCSCIGSLACLTKSDHGHQLCGGQAQGTKDLLEWQRKEEMPLPMGCSWVRWGQETDHEVDEEEEEGGEEEDGGRGWRWRWRCWGSYRLLGSWRWPRSKGLMRMTTRQPKKEKLDLKRPVWPSQPFTADLRITFDWRGQPNWLSVGLSAAPLLTSLNL